VLIIRFRDSIEAGIDACVEAAAFFKENAELHIMGGSKRYTAIIGQVLKNAQSRSFNFVFWRRAGLPVLICKCRLIFCSQRCKKEWNDEHQNQSNDVERQLDRFRIHEQGRYHQ
jgi:hypothetical protein